MLVCTLASVTLAWWLATRDRKTILHTISARQTFTWTTISFDGETHGEIATDGLGNVHMVIARDEQALQYLRGLPDVCKNLQSLAIVGQETFEQTTISDLPALTNLSVSDVDLSGKSLTFLAKFPNLENLDIPWTAGAHPAELAALPTLTNLTVRTDTNSQVDNFPRISQIKSLTIYCTECSDDEFRRLRDRMPECHVFINVGTPQDNAWLE